MIFTFQDALNAELSKIEMSLEEKSSELEVSKVELSQKEEEVCRLQKLWETDKVKQEEKIQDLVRNFLTIQWGSENRAYPVFK